MMNNTFTFLTIINVNFCIWKQIFKLFKLKFGNVITDCKKSYLLKKTCALTSFN